MPNELKPCPFCGSEAVTDYQLLALPKYTMCSFEHCELHDVAILIREWNSRPLEAALQARIEELEKAAVVWHKYPDEKPPIDGRYLFWDSDGNAPHVLPYNDIVVRDNPGVFSTQTHWAYLSAPPQEEK